VVAAVVARRDAVSEAEVEAEAAEEMPRGVPFLAAGVGVAS